MVSELSEEGFMVLDVGCHSFSIRKVLTDLFQSPIGLYLQQLWKRASKRWKRRFLEAYNHAKCQRNKIE